MSAAQKRLPTLLWILLAVVVSALARGVGSERLTLPDGEGWVCLDPDSLYHVRRVERALDEDLAVAGRDPYLNFPAGADIPWPPYYTWLASRALAAGVPGSSDAPGNREARRGFVERGVASLPPVFGVLTTIVVALVGLLLAGRTGAVVAGLTHALAGKAVSYAGLGNGDHHAFVSLCLACSGLLFSLVLSRDGLARRRTALGYGFALGALAGLAVGSWVGALAYVVLAELVLAVLLLLRARAARTGQARCPHLASLGLAFHVTALAVLAPALLASPWRATSPWMVINLSWFHLAFLALGGCVFAPLFFTRPGSALERRYPWLVLIALTGLAGALAALDLGPARGLREAFEWAGRGDAFMARVAESDPLLTLGARRIFAALGFGLLLLPLAWAAALARSLRGRAPALLPWVVWTPVLAYQALQQQRFAEPLALPLAVLLGWGAGALADARRIGSRAPADASPSGPGAWLAPGLGALLAIALQWPTVASTLRRARVLSSAPRPVESLGLRPAVRLLCEWIRGNTPPVGSSAAPAVSGGPGVDDYSVMAFWHWGHFIEWAADRPSVATNFGSYVGADSFLDPSRFFMEDDDRAAEALLERRRARYVLVTSHLLNGLPTLLQALPRERWTEMVEVGPGGIEALGAARPGLWQTVGARLSQLEILGVAEEYVHVPFLRLVHVSRARDARPDVRAPGPEGTRTLRTGTVWERVPGAFLEARGQPGTRLSARLWVDFPAAEFQILWRSSAVADADGIARLRVPYATDRPAGDGRARGPLHWKFGPQSGQKTVAEGDIRAGTTLELP